MTHEHKNYYELGLKASELPEPLHKTLKKRKKGEKLTRYYSPFKKTKDSDKVAVQVSHNESIRCPNNQKQRTNDLYCHGEKMYFESFRVKERPNRRPINQVVYVCHVCGHHKWQNINGRIPAKYASENIIVLKRKR